MASTAWSCEVCTFANNQALHVCEMCDTPRPPITKRLPDIDDDIDDGNHVSAASSAGGVAAAYGDDVDDDGDGDNSYFYDDGDDDDDADGGQNDSIDDAPGMPRAHYLR